MGMPKPTANRTSRPKPSRKPAAPLDELTQELALAFRLDRAALLFVIAETETLRARAARTLLEKIKGSGYAVQWMDADRVTDNDIPMALKAKRNRAGTVYFVRNLAQGGLAALRALNIRREMFSGLGVRVVFWLTPTEEAQLAHQAPDFWAFRHRTVALIDPAELAEK